MRDPASWLPLAAAESSRNLCFAEYCNIITDGHMPRNEAKARTTVKNVGFLPLYVEDPFDSVDIQSTKAHPPPPPLSSLRIFTISRVRARRSCIFFPGQLMYSQEKFIGREIAWRPTEPTRWWRGPPAPGPALPGCPKIGQQASEICCFTVYSKIKFSRFLSVVFTYFAHLLF